MIQFYSPDIEKNHFLPDEEARHCVRVLRKNIGDEIVIVDGKGKRFFCRISSISRHNVEVEILRTETVPCHWHPKIEIAVAPTKNADRIEWMVEKLTEMGIDRFTPLKCEHSERKNINQERLNRIAVSAMKQSLKATCPEIDELTSFQQYVNEPFEGDKFICYCDNDKPRETLLDLKYSKRPVRILIGPEGDFSKEEVEEAFKMNYKPITLGESRLRTETAGLIACADVHAVRRLKLRQENL